MGGCPPPLNPPLLFGTFRNIMRGAAAPPPPAAFQILAQKSILFGTLYGGLPQPPRCSLHFGASSGKNKQHFSEHHGGGCRPPLLFRFRRIILEVNAFRNKKCARLQKSCPCRCYEACVAIQVLVEFSYLQRSQKSCAAEVYFRCCVCTKLRTACVPD